MAKFKIVTFDGGGILGYLSLGLLSHIEKELGKKWVEKSNMFAGTSTGGLIALEMANGGSVKEMMDWYKTEGPNIFHQSWLEKITNPGRIFHSPYKTKRLREGVCKRIDPEVRLTDFKKKILITSFDLDNESGEDVKRRWKPKIFHNFKGNTPDDIKAVDAALYTTAAPSYFPSVNGYIDGGVAANNPAMCALAQVLDKRNSGKKYSLDDILIVSVGTGNKSKHIDKKTIKWGIAGWAPRLVDILMDGTEELADYQCARMLPDCQYLRIQIDIPDSFQMDSINKLDEIEKLAFDADVSGYVDWIKANWK